MNRELSPEELARLHSVPDTPPRKAPTRTANTEDRTYPGWFKLAHSVTRNCEVTGHDHVDNDGNPVGRNRTTAIIDGVAVCRYCFLAGTDKTSPKPTTTGDTAPRSFDDMLKDGTVTKP